MTENDYCRIAKKIVDIIAYEGLMQCEAKELLVYIEVALGKQAVQRSTDCASPSKR